MPHALVTGGAGFIGSHLSEALLADGWQVTVVDNLSTGFKANVPTGATLVEADTADPSVTALIERGGVDAVLHHAAQINVRASVENPGFDAETNIVATLALLEACRRAGVGRFVFASSGGTVYGEPSHLPATEDLPLQPLSPYGCSKASIELYLRYYQVAYGLQTLALRYGNVYGPRQNPHGEAGVVAIFCQKLLRGETPTVFGDGSQTRDYIFVQDVVRANLAALRYPHSGTFNIGTGIETDVNTIFHHIDTALGGGQPIQHGAARTGELQRIALDCTHAHNTLGWQPQTPLADGIAQTVAWFQAQGA